MRKLLFLFPTWSDTNQAVQLQKMAGGFKFLIKIEEGLRYLCSENKNADHLSGCGEVDLHFCFCICKTLCFFFMTQPFSMTSAFQALTYIDEWIFKEQLFPHEKRW